MALPGKYSYGRILRFLIVGVSNTALHFLVLNASFFLLQQSKIASSIIATIVAMTYSFILNRSFVFRSKDRHIPSQVIAFVAVTVSGMLMMHNVVYIAVLWLLEHNAVGVTVAIEEITRGALSADFIDINLSTLVGAIFAMVWNYNGYRLFVFKNTSKADDERKDDEQD